MRPRRRPGFRSARFEIGDDIDNDRLVGGERLRQRRREVLRLCIKMALCDGEYADSEAHAIGVIAYAFDVPSEELQAIFDAVAARR